LRIFCYNFKISPQAQAFMGYFCDFFTKYYVINQKQNKTTLSQNFDS